jgi:hypothetical protein
VVQDQRVYERLRTQLKTARPTLQLQETVPAEEEGGDQGLASPSRGTGAGSPLDPTDMEASGGGGFPDEPMVE